LLGAGVIAIGRMKIKHEIKAVYPARSKIRWEEIENNEESTGVKEHV
jgi:hypothetical protein